MRVAGDSDFAGAFLRREAWFKVTAQIQFVCTPFRKLNVLPLHTEVILLAFLVLFLVFRLVAVRRTLLRFWLTTGSTLQLLQPRFDLIHQPNIFVILYDPRRGLVILHRDLLSERARPQVHMT